MRHMKRLTAVWLAAWVAASALGSFAVAQSKVSLIHFRGGQASYVPDAQGNRIPDFSSCGYMRSEQTIPCVPVKAVVSPTQGDAAADVQAAIDYVSELTPDAQGFRGAVLLKDGTYRLSAPLYIKASGVVLRGSDRASTCLTAADASVPVLLTVRGTDNRQYGRSYTVTDSFLPVGGDVIHLKNKAFRTGDRVEVAAGGLCWEREVLSVDASAGGVAYRLDAPLTFACASATVRRLSWKGRLEQVGIENLTLCAYPASASAGISLENMENGWVRRVVFRGLADGAVKVSQTASRLTIEDGHSMAPFETYGPREAATFEVKGAMCLLQRIQAENGWHDFAVDGVQGPVALVQCWSLRPYAYSGTVGALSSGVLLDICAVDGESLRFGRPDAADRFKGFTATNSVLWNAQGAVVSCDRPDEGMNWSFGAWGGFNGKGYWYGSNNHQSPWSLFYAQLAARTGGGKSEEKLLIHLGGGGTSTAEDARYQNEASKKGLILLTDRMREIALNAPLDTAFTPEMETVWKKH